MNASGETANLDEFLETPEPSPIWRYGKWALLAVAIFLFVLFVSRLFFGENGVEYVTDTVKRGDITVNVTATGNLAPTEQVEVGSEISGIVRKVLVDVNDRVSKGQVIAMIDTDRLNDIVKQSQASLAASQASAVSAHATLDEAQAQLRRLQEVNRLSNGQVPSETEMAAQQAVVARAIGSLNSARANVIAAQAELSSNRTQLSRATIRAPVSGVVLKRLVDPGQTVQASFNTPSLFIIAEDLSRMQLEVAVDEADVGQVQTGQSGSFTVDAYPGEKFPATILRVNLGSTNLSGSSSTSTASTSDVVSYTALLNFNNDDLKLRPGMTATATIRTSGEKDVLMIPNAALRYIPPKDQEPEESSGFGFSPPRSDGTHVTQETEIGVGSRQTIYVLGDDDKLQKVTVVTGQSNGRQTAITGKGLKIGQRVVTGQKAKAAE
ncbi:MAG: efflux RND transporter periplasmic adaptor subunit [Parasphingorhabdus sp.]|uniref:efflux RND transporter periplasmic adaptor subunit n=1 Tax=Parasphingorhabdus sp. TaxID=2709688 RepID=UPI0030015797